MGPLSSISRIHRGEPEAKNVYEEAEEEAAKKAEEEAASTAKKKDEEEAVAAATKKAMEDVATEWKPKKVAEDKAKPEAQAKEETFVKIEKEDQKLLRLENARSHHQTKQ